MEEVKKDKVSKGGRMAGFGGRGKSSRECSCCHQAGH